MMAVNRIMQASKSFFVDPSVEMDDVINFLLVRWTNADEI